MIINQLSLSLSIDFFFFFSPSHGFLFRPLSLTAFPWAHSQSSSSFPPSNYVTFHCIRLSICPLFHIFSFLMHITHTFYTIALTHTHVLYTSSHKPLLLHLFLSHPFRPFFTFSVSFPFFLFLPLITFFFLSFFHSLATCLATFPAGHTCSSSEAKWHATLATYTNTHNLHKSPNERRNLSWKFS